MTFAPRLHLIPVARAASLGLKQSDVARMFGVSEAAVSKFKQRNAIAFRPPRKTGKVMIEPEKRSALVEAYARHEAEAGGLENADVRLCLTKAAAECGVNYEDAADAMRRHWAGYVRVG